MTSIDPLKSGFFCWIELATTDQSAAKQFYGSLFGWTADDIPMGPGDLYTIFQLHGRGAAAAYTLPPDRRAAGIPPNWMLYILAENADEAAARVAQAGGKICKPAFDVMEMGRMAVLEDPTGAAFCVWQVKGQGSGGLAADEPGTLVWADLNTPDPARARKFYADVFGWNFVEDTRSVPPYGYLQIQNGEKFIGGIPPVDPAGAQLPPHWLPYFLVASCDATVAQAKPLGASVLQPAFTMEGIGRIAVLGDPQGAVFALYEPHRR
jgi:uncharacterized protein